jgi:hypothetical protein
VLIFSLQPANLRFRLPRGGKTPQIQHVVFRATRTHLLRLDGSAASIPHLHFTSPLAIVSYYIHRVAIMVCSLQNVQLQSEDAVRGFLVA